MRDYRFYRREFLNLEGHHSHAHIIAASPKDRAYGSVSLMDCSEVINLSLEWRDEDEYENTLHKLDTLIDILKDFKKSIQKSYKAKDWTESY